MAYGDTFSNAYQLTFSPQTGAAIGTAVSAPGGIELVSTASKLGSGDPTVQVSPLGSVEYQGTAIIGGAYDGIVVFDPNNGMSYLLTNAPVSQGSPLTIDYANNPVPGSKAGFNVETDKPIAATCFMAGTAIRTPSGDRAVESLAAGDIVTLVDGRNVPVIWLGRQTVVAQFADPVRSTPIRIKAHAIAPSQPERDLLVSPAHAVLVDGILVQAGALVNGVSILRETSIPPRFVYYHVELGEHALLLAEGLAAESFVNNAKEGPFDNWNERADASVTEMDLPLAKSARQVPASIQARLLARAAELGVDLAAAA